MSLLGPAPASRRRVELRTVWVDPTVDPADGWGVHRWTFGDEGRIWDELPLRQLDPARLGGPPAAALRYAVELGWPRAGPLGRVGPPLPAPIEALRRAPDDRALDAHTLSARLPFALAMRQLRASPARRAADDALAHGRVGPWLATGDVAADGDRVLTVSELPRKILASGLWAAEIGATDMTLFAPHDDVAGLEQESFTTLHVASRRYGGALAAAWDEPAWGRDGAGLPVLELAGAAGRRRIRVRGVSTVREVATLLWGRRTALGLALAGGAALALTAGAAAAMAPHGGPPDHAGELEAALHAAYPACTVRVEGPVVRRNDGERDVYLGPDGLHIYLDGTECPAASDAVFSLSNPSGIGVMETRERLVAGAEGCAGRCDP